MQASLRKKVGIGDRYCYFVNFCEIKVCPESGLI